jgi:hypothetical protein
MAFSNTSRYDVSMRLPIITDNGITPIKVSHRKTIIVGSTFLVLFVAIVLIMIIVPIFMGVFIAYNSKSLSFYNFGSFLLDFNGVKKGGLQSINVSNSTEFLTKP